MQIGSIHTVAAIAAYLGLETRGDADQVVTGINVPECTVSGDLTLWVNGKVQPKDVRASFFITNDSIDLLPNQACILSKNPIADYNRLVQKFVPYRKQMSMEGENCVIADTAHLSPNCFIGHDVVIGERTIIHPGAYIGDGTVIEEDVIIGPNAVIGQKAFSIQTEEAQQIRLHTCGFVYLSKNVEVGAGSIIESGVSSITEIKEGTKINNLVQIGHDVQVGAHCIVHAQSTIKPFQVIPDFSVV